MKKGVQKKDSVKRRKTSPRIIITAIAALIFVILSFWNWLFILPAVVLWWINKKAIKKHFGN